MVQIIIGVNDQLHPGIPVYNGVPELGLFKFSAGIDHQLDHPR